MIDLNDVLQTHNTSGLANLGATCYMNTVIQCLGFCPNFLKFILAGNRAKAQTPLANDLKDVYVALWIEQKAIAPHGFLRSLQRQLGTYLNIFEQNDITEFLMLYLDKLNSDLGIEILVDDKDFLALRKRCERQYNNQLYRDLAYQMDVAWLKTITKEYSPIMDLFYGQLVSQIVCGNCNHIHHNYETYCNLSLPLTCNDNASTSLADVFAEYFKDELINHAGKEWTCDSCKQSKPSKKSLRLWKNPNILIVSLKRFDYNFIKNTRTVAASPQLSLEKYTIHSERKQYHLVAVGNHMGSMGSGHYNCICKHKSNKWYAIDDTTVREANTEEVEYVVNNGYVYFYEALE